MKDRLLDAARKGNADYVDVRFEESDRTDIDFRRDHVESVSSSRMTGGIVRACHKGGWGLTTFDSMDDLDKSIAEACDSARMVGQTETLLAEAPGAPEGADVEVEMKEDPRFVSLDDKIELTREYNEVLVRHDNIESTDVGYYDVHRTIHSASNRGISYSEQRPACAITLSATARKGSLLQSASNAIRSRNDFK